MQILRGCLQNFSKQFFVGEFFLFGIENIVLFLKTISHHHYDKSQLQMIYKKISPPAHLKPYVECFYVWESSFLQPLIVESPPSAFTSMVFNYGVSYSVQNLKHQLSAVPQVFLTGQATTSYRLSVFGEIGMVGIVFRPAGMHTLFNLPLGELTDERFDMTEILRGGEIRVLQDKIMEARNLNERISLLTHFLTNQLMKNEHCFDAVDFTANQIVNAKGLVNVSDMMNDLFMCRRQFERKFFLKVGLSPKFYARTRRLGHICYLISGKRKVNWQNVLYDSTYYDQAHFIKDFTTFLGRTPTDYLKNNVELSHFLNQSTVKL
jgi:AraC-like DNA-binding protein